MKFLSTPIGLGCTLPGLLAEEEERTNLHSVRAADLSKITIRVEGLPPLDLTDAESLKQVEGLCQSSATYFHLGLMTLDEFELELHFKDRRSRSYRAVFLGWRANDVSLTPLSDSRFSPQPDLLLHHAGSG